MLPPGVHRVRRKLAGGRVSEHWYAWRGGPSILSATADGAAALEREVSRLAPEAVARHGALVRPPPAPGILSTLIAAFLGPEDGKPAPHLAHLAHRTRADLRKHLDRAREDLGELPLSALTAAGARKMLLDWRDGYSATPRTADAYLSALGQLFAWAKGKEEIAANPLQESWPRLYTPKDHADALWTKADLIRLLRGAPVAFRQAVLFSILTGFRGSDAVRVTWAHVGKRSIAFPTGKSRGRKVVTVPITPPLRALLAQIGRKDAGAVLTSAHGTPWTFSGLQTAMQRRKREVGITGLRWHDLRGTAATRLVRAGLPVEDVALIVGWERTRVEALSYYVTADAVAEGMLARLEALKRRS